MITVAIWWSCILLELLILFRGMQTGAVVRLPFFHLYVGGMFVCDAFLYYVYRFTPASYPRLSWNCGLLVLLLACGILLEIFRHALLPYPGAERFARLTGFAVFLVIFAAVGVGSVVRPDLFQSRLMNTNLERNLLIIQAIFFCCLIQILRYFRITLDRNLLGIAIGYGVCLGLTLPMLSLEMYAGHRFSGAWMLLQPLAYLVSLLVWTVALWHCEGKSSDSREDALAADYESFVTLTRDSIEVMRANIGKAVQ
jgi:hypothetical protein